MKKLLSSLFAIVVLAGCQSTPSEVTSAAPTLNELLVAAANEVNKTAPMMVDSGTRLDSSLVVGNKFLYKYTMIDYAVEDLDTQKFHDIILKQVSGFVCTSPDMSFFVDNKVDVAYSYYDKANKFITEAVVKTGQCESYL